MVRIVSIFPLISSSTSLLSMWSRLSRFFPWSPVQQDYFTGGLHCLDFSPDLPFNKPPFHVVQIVSIFPLISRSARLLYRWSALSRFFPWSPVQQASFPCGPNCLDFSPDIEFNKPPFHVVQIVSIFPWSPVQQDYFTGGLNCLDFSPDIEFNKPPFHVVQIVSIFPLISRSTRLLYRWSALSRFFPWSPVQQASFPCCPDCLDFPLISCSTRLLSMLSGLSQFSPNHPVNKPLFHVIRVVSIFPLITRLTTLLSMWSRVSRFFPWSPVQQAFFTGGPDCLDFSPDHPFNKPRFHVVRIVSIFPLISRSTRLLSWPRALITISISISLLFQSFVNYPTRKFKYFCRFRFFFFFTQLSTVTAKSTRWQDFFFFLLINTRSSLPENSNFWKQ